MQEPSIKQYPTEMFGFPFTDQSIRAQKARETQYCPFLNRTCTKPRKSEPHIKVGICSVGYSSSFYKGYKPVIICPERFNLKPVFNAIQKRHFGDITKEYEILWVSEVSLGVGGAIDYVAVKRRKTPDGGDIEDFVCVEFQAAGTTGTPWEAVLEYKNSGKFTKDRYKYGINWANEFAKTMMQQVYKKGKIIELWERKIIFVLQDVGLTYLQHAYDTSGLRKGLHTDPIHFYTFKMLWSEPNIRWELLFDNEFSTDTNGIVKILGGADKTSYPTIDKFLQNIRKRLPQ